MIISFALGLVGALLVLANNKFLRIPWISVTVFILAATLAASGVYFLLNPAPKFDTVLLFPVFTPLIAFFLLLITRILFRKYVKKEIILYMRGLFPVRQEERYVTRLEIRITGALVILSVVIPYLILLIVL